MSFKVEGVEEFAASIKKAQSIVITAHLYPDYDAICSAILLARTLQFNYPEKQVQVVLEDRPRIGTVAGKSQEITVMPILDSLHHYDADCIILTDTNRFDKVTRGEKSKLISYVAQRGIETIVIDHHEREGEDEFAVQIQDPAVPAATQLVYQVCFHGLALLRPSNIDQITMLGIIDDSGLFTYTYDYSDTFTVVAELIQGGASIERAVAAINQLTTEQMTVIAELANNMKIETGYVYSFISDEFMQEKLPAECGPSEFKAACTMFGNRYINAVRGVKWGFIVYPNLINLKTKEYRVSFRSQADAKKDIATITSYLGSGGGHHKHAAGANVSAANVSDALHKVKSAILATK
ncbi:MAG: DHH family phosphoesterase [Candidatus Saccharimonadales bacterium]